MAELQQFALTFGLRYGDEEHPTFAKANPRGWVTVLAPGYEAARTLVNEKIGNNWAFLYPVAEFRATRYPLGEIDRWTFGEPEAPPVHRSGLLDQVSADGVHHPTVMRLYCWSCQTVHALPLADVERIVYALGADAADRGPGADRVPQEDFISSCPKYVLQWANDIEMYAEHVEQGVSCRKLGVTVDA